MSVLLCIKVHREFGFWAIMHSPFKFFPSSTCDGYFSLYDSEQQQEEKNSIKASVEWFALPMWLNIHNDILSSLFKLIVYIYGLFLCSKKTYPVPRGCVTHFGGKIIFAWRQWIFLNSFFGKMPFLLAPQQYVHCETISLHLRIHCFNWVNRKQSEKILHGV